MRLLEKVLLSAFALLLLLPVSSVSAAAEAPDLSIYIDDVLLLTEVAPEIVADRVFLPLRAVSEYLGADIEWQEPDVLLKRHGVSLTLTIGGMTALKDGEALTLETAPYIRGGRTMIPLRFIGEAFDCDVNYTDGNVRISTPPLYIDDTRVVSVQYYYKMTLGGILSESKTKIYISRLYQYLYDIMDDEITMSDYFGDAFTEHSLQQYFPNEISFMETDGLSGKAILQYRVYSNYDSDEWHFYSNESSDYRPVRVAVPGKCLVHETTQDKWYLFPDSDAFSPYLYLRYDIGTWEEIENTTP